MRSALFRMLAGIFLIPLGCATPTDAPDGEWMTVFKTDFAPGDSTALSDWDIFDHNGALKRTSASFSDDVPPGAPHALVLTVPQAEYPSYINAMRFFPRIDGTHRYRLSLWMKKTGPCFAAFGSAELERNLATGAIKNWTFRTGAIAHAEETVWSSYTTQDTLTIGQGLSLAVWLRADSLDGRFAALQLERWQDK